ncbi:uncharacterized protein LOC144660743 [Oculina patagonica]
MKTLPLLALVGFMLATGLSVPFEENEREEQSNTELKGIEDYPVSRKEKGEYDFHTEEDNFDDDNFGDYDVSDVDDDDEYVKFNGQDDEGRIIHSRIDHEEFSDPQRRIRIRPRTYNRVRRVVRKPLTLRRLRGRAQSGRRGRKGR